jgi:hypothetical protein
MGDRRDVQSGLLCDQCGGTLADDRAPGYPRTCISCAEQIEEDNEILDAYDDDD